MLCPPLTSWLSSTSRSRIEDTRRSASTGAPSRQSIVKSPDSWGTRACNSGSHNRSFRGTAHEDSHKVVLCHLRRSSQGIWTRNIAKPSGQSVILPLLTSTFALVTSSDYDVAKRASVAAIGAHRRNRPRPLPESVGLPLAPAGYQQAGSTPRVTV